MDGYAFCDAISTVWRQSDWADGVEVKDLGRANGCAMQWVRFRAGASFPAHVHSGPEFIYLLEGEAYQQGQRLGPGWASAATAGTVDERFHSPSGCTFLTVYTE